MKTKDSVNKERVDQLLASLKSTQSASISKVQQQLDELFLLLEKVNAPLMLLEAYDIQANVFRLNEKYQLFKEISNKGLTLSREINHAYYIPKFLLYLSKYELNTGEKELAKKYLEEGLEIVQKHNLIELEVWFFLDKGWILHQEVKNDQAIEFFLKAIEIAKSKCESLLGICYTNYAENLFDHQAKREFLMKALPLILQQSSDYHKVRCYYSLARVNAVLKNFDEAKELAFKAYEIAQKNGAIYLLYISLIIIIQVDLKKAKVLPDQKNEILKDTPTWFESLLEFSKQSDRKLVLIQACSTQIQVYTYLEEYDQAIKILPIIEPSLSDPKIGVRRKFNISQICYNCANKAKDFEMALKYHQLMVGFENETREIKMQKAVQETEAKFQAKEKKAELERLQELEILKTRFFSQITHELRTPLTLIQGPAKQILQSDSLNEIYQYATIIERNSDRLLLLVNQLLDVNKLEAGKMELKPSHGEITPFLETIISSFQMLANQKQIQLDIISDIGDLIINFDADKIEKILFNLLSNAFKFTPAKGQIICQFQLLDKVDEKTQNIEFVVSDTGKGIAQEEIAYIFDRFYQADSSYTREAEGTGIGLALVKELTAIMGGQIDVQSKVGEGTRFRIVLPLELVAEEEIKANLNMPIQPQLQTSMSPILQTKVKSKNLPILLLIEDNIDMHHYITGIFENDFILLQAYDGVEGIKLAKERVPDIIISDVMMPIKDGYQVCSELKKDNITSHIPVILLTAKAALESRIEGLEHGADAYLSKPFSAKELVLQTHNLITTRNNQQAKYSTFATNQVAYKVKEDKETDFLNKVLELIDKNIHDDNLNVNYLSDLMFISNSQLYRKIQALTNTSVSQLIRYKRLSKGKSLLESKNGNVSEIARKVGLTPSYFSKLFIKQYGYSPKKLLN